MRTALIPLTLLTVLGCSPEGQPLEPATPDLSPALAASAQHSSPQYRVTVTNLTTSQPLSPGVVLTHAPSYRLFKHGVVPGDGLRLIAEDGDPSLLAPELAAENRVIDFVATSAPVFRIGGPGPTALTVDLDGSSPSDRLSLALMLICTNDGFVGLDRVKLPRRTGDIVTYYTGTYDAGTEANDELSTSIVDPCFAIGPVAGAADGNARTATLEGVHPHPGIQGVGDLSPAAHGWTGPVARVTIERLQ